ncbi:hypothetical protein RV11_GL000272 [Enterococcus phoeniculicola]|jgi:two-component system response regulator LytT|uniref:Response regulator n=1 Tax=Enterococcus phoeniculicola ATCC BAA-412 TaxID=1158610 RepID=R3W998_9ENTE|nr:LytTR family DNA-binding domain-containing protein [Enterococcus phoeniculicola]EOL44017.1 hypothetical protein UC3_01647 [Enterococcus phoeniculicola ATCC BAA-412]EOT75119.1 hypothetical protein I589_02719 [Enterococcus phoeniculicola ATCC BAA-412]OJG71566.1 hypothetical protein RV11_GL000272 [Enterococcus phoeniculicola]
MRLALCEDKQLHQKEFQAVISQMKEDYDIQLTIYDSAEALLFSLEDTPVDVIFFDIQLEGKLNGMEAAKKIRAQNNFTPIVFLSNYDEYVFDGYDVGALGYIMKPITEQQMAHLLSKVAKLQEVPTILVKTKGINQSIPLFDILYFEIMGHTLSIVTQNDVYELTGTLSMYDDWLTDDFIGIHRSFKINLAHAIGIDGATLLMKNNRRLPIARSQKKQVKEAFLSHYRRLSYEN